MSVNETKMKQTSPKHQLEANELSSLPPRDRDEYSQKILMNFLEANPAGATTSEIMDKTNLSRTTITKQLGTLMKDGKVTESIHAIGKIQVSVFKTVGKRIHEKRVKDQFSDDVFYSFFSVERDRERYIYIQEKEIDEFRKERVRGAIAVSSKDFDIFIKEIMQFALETGQKERETERRS
jgi:DNA-binding MarR family transcriptional regulator